MKQLGFKQGSKLLHCDSQDIILFKKSGFFLCIDINEISWIHRVNFVIIIDIITKEIHV